MAAFSVSPELSTGDTSSNWRLQGKRRIEPRPSLLNGGGFASWTNVPPVGVPDPHVADQMRQGKQTFPHFKHSVSGNDPYKEDAGKRITLLGEQPVKFDEKHHYPSLFNARNTKEIVPMGVRQVESRAKRMTAGHADPNTVVKQIVPSHPEGVRMYPGANDVGYNCWEPQDLKNARGGDWNWNTKFGFRKVAKMENGEPKRQLAHPVAWPSYPGYPPDRDAATDTRVDYALARHGGTFKVTGVQHPDLITSRANRVAASDPGRYNQSMRCRHPNY